MPGPFDQSNLQASGDMLPDPLPADPFPLAAAWYEDAHARRIQPNPNAMTLATIDADGRPSARIVLCKALEPGAGSLVFFTNYASRKGGALLANPRAAIVFHWDALDRQIRIEGPTAKVTEAESDAYFATRPWESRLGAWASNQSQPIGSRRGLLDQLGKAMARFGLDPAKPPEPGAKVEIPRPPHWGGFRLFADRAELWISAPGRFHDRAVWTRALSPDPARGFVGSPWSSTRLQP